MIYQEAVARQIADFLLEIKAVILRPNQPFTWASGWKSPIYCDNRLILSVPSVRTYVKTNWADAVRDLFPVTEALVGVATAGIPHAALVADVMGLPMAYVRAKPKEHGTGKMVEGYLAPDKPVLVIEDLVSTGKSSLQAVDSLRNEGISVGGMMSIFSYGFAESKHAFEDKKVKFACLCDYDTLTDQALRSGYIQEQDMELLRQWRTSPSTWGK